MPELTGRRPLPARGRPPLYVWPGSQQQGRRVTQAPQKRLEKKAFGVLEAASSRSPAIFVLGLQGVCTRQNLAEFRLDFLYARSV